MSVEDIEFAVQITDTMNWNLTEQDFKFMLDLEPEGCFVLIHDSERIGAATAISFDEVGWIGNVIVDEKHRGKGAGSTLLKHAMHFLIKKGARTIGLYAYSATVNFYTQLGFKRNSEFTVLNGKVKALPIKETSYIQKTDSSHLQKIIDFDRFYFGASRGKLLKKISSQKGNLCYCYVDNGEILGYAMAKVYGWYAEIGPLVCRREKSLVAPLLLHTVLNKLDGCEVSVCLPKKEKKLVDMLLNAGLIEGFDVVRMSYEPLAFKDCVYIAESLERG
ncbi:MAG: GNAT family N-acetyltransferase [Candidatus Bathyarchaeia archaeon]